jgi:SAM-dependent methyltransferase
VAFDAADSYGRFMGRYSEPLAVPFARWCGVQPGQRVVDVGCGPGALTAALADLVGREHVLAADPSGPFVAAARRRLPGVRVEVAPAEALPFDDDVADVAVAQLVVHFMSDPVRGLREMGRVVRPGGVVAACVWDFGGGRAPLSTFWQGAQAVDGATVDESHLSGAREGDLGRLCREAGLVEVEEGELSVHLAFDSFEQWWEPYTLGVGPAGDHVAGLDEEGVVRLREACRALLPDPPFGTTVWAWAARARVPAAR